MQTKRDVAAYLVELPRTPAPTLILDAAVAVDYAVKHHGVVVPLVRVSALDDLERQLARTLKELEFVRAEVAKLGGEE